MKNIAIIISHIPHGQAKGREALDIALSLSDINHISVIFMGDGVFHLLPNQQPDKILMRDYISTFNMLELYDINDVFACHTSLKERNLVSCHFTIAVKTINSPDLQELIASHDVILHF